jgi:hypothetical protein
MLRLSVLLSLLVALVAAPAAAASTLEIHVVAHNDIGQVAYVQPPGGQPWQSTDNNGVIKIAVNPGDTLHISRDANQLPPGAPASCGAPEDPDGVAYTVPSPVPANPVNVTLPNAAEPYHPEASDKENWLIGQLNSVRSAHGLGLLTVSSTLMRAADETARASVLANTFPPPSCFVLLVDAGWPDRGFLFEDAKGTDPVYALKHWDGDLGDSESKYLAQKGVLDPNNVYIGVGDGDGWFIAEFQQASGCPSNANARCGIQAGSVGDPNAWTPPPPDTGGGGAGGQPANGGGATAGSGGGTTGTGGTGGQIGTGGSFGAGSSAVNRASDAAIRSALTAFSPAPALARNAVTGNLFLPVDGALSWRVELTGFRTARAARKLVLGKGTLAVARGALTLRLKLSRAGKAGLKRTRGGKVALRLTLKTADGRVFHGTARVKVVKR